MKSKRIYTKLKSESPHRIWDSEELDSFLRIVDFSDVVNIAWEQDLSAVVIIYVAEMIAADRVEYDKALEVDNPPQPKPNYEGEGETPLGEQIDGGEELQDDFFQ
jgi:hypothetical protein